MLLVPMVCYFVYKYVPMANVYWAFTNYGAVAKSKVRFIGFENFEKLLGTSAFKRSFKNTLILSFYNMMFGFPIPIMLALLLNEVQTTWYKKFTQTVLYLPHFLSWIIVASLFYLLLSPQNSVNAQIADIFGKEPIYWFASPQYARGLLTVTGIWKDAGYNAIVYLAALAGVDQGLYEAATIDGATKFQKIKYVSLPCIRPIIVTMLILKLAGVLNIFHQVFAMSNGLIMKKIDVIQTYAYRTGIEDMKIGYSMAVSLFKAVISLALVLGTNALARKVSDGEEGVF